ncbi:MAG: hypothetical protein HY671_07190, partial [Chloroflexi bacterium]|nr:hypothetical protein [Chloroflexota bacterium]
MDKPLPPLSHKGTWRTYTTADGLAGLLVEHIAEDREGYLWFATATGGVTRFDGDEFRTFTARDGLCGDQVYAALLDRQGRLWFGAWDGGICWYDGHSFYPFGEESGLANRSVTYIFEDREGLIWVGGADVLGHCDSAGFHDLTPAYRRQYAQAPGTCWGIAQDEEGRIWFGLRGNLVYYAGSAFQRSDDLPLSQEGVYSVAPHSAGGLWIGHRERIWHCAGRTCRPVPVEFRGYVRKIQRDREGRTWFCLTGGGVLCCDGVGFHHFAGQDGLASDNVNAMFQDWEGQYWFATWGGGVSACDPHSLHVFGGEVLPHREVLALKEDRQGLIWIGFSDLFPPSSSAPKGICFYDGERFATLDMEEGLDTLVIHEDRSGHLWFGGFQGLRRYDRQTTRTTGTEEGFDGIMVTAIAEDQEGHLFLGHWDAAGSEVRITRWDGRRFETLFRERKKDALCNINAIIATREGGLWFARGGWNGQGTGRGIGRLDAAGNITSYTTEDGLVDNRVEDLLEDQQGDLWIATWGGISRFDGARFHNFTIENGVPNVHVQCICEDRRGHLWFGTEGGVLHCDGRLFQYIRSPDIVYLNKIIQDRSGRFWFATLNGAVRYTPSRIAPRVRVQQVIADQVYTAIEKVEIPASVQQVIFEYKGMSFRTHPRDMLYTYRLQGHEEDWRPVTRSLRAFY